MPNHDAHIFVCPDSFYQRMDKGDFAGKELFEIQTTNPEWYSRLEKDPFITRYEFTYASSKKTVKNDFYTII